MGFSLAALFGLGKKAGPKPPHQAAPAAAANAEPARSVLAASAKPAAAPAPAAAGASAAGISALVRVHAAAAARGDETAAYDAACALAEAFKSRGRLQLSSKWAAEAGEIAVGIATAGGDRAVVARAAAAAALKSIEAGRPLAAGPHAGVITRVCGVAAAALLAEHGAWLAGLGFQTTSAPAENEETLEPVAA